MCGLGPRVPTSNRCNINIHNSVVNVLNTPIYLIDALFFVVYRRRYYRIRTVVSTVGEHDRPTSVPRSTVRVQTLPTETRRTGTVRENYSNLLNRGDGRDADRPAAAS